jgi:hypothetical protein
MFSKASARRKTLTLRGVKKLNRRAKNRRLKGNGGREYTLPVMPVRDVY